MNDKQAKDVGTRSPANRPRKILVVDDEPDIVEMIAFNLGNEGFSVLRAGDGEQALEAIRRDQPHLVVLDLLLPRLGGLDVCRAVRRNEATEHLPIIMLTAKSDPVERILGLEIGADDYVIKPFHVRELVARIRAVLRRSEERPSPPPGEETLTIRDLHMDFLSYEVKVRGRSVTMSHTEFKLLRFLAEKAGRVFHRNQILDAIWGDETFVEPRTVDVHISRLRSIIEKDKEHPEYILTVRGIGYKFADR